MCKIDVRTFPASLGMKHDAIFLVAWLSTLVEYSRNLSSSHSIQTSISSTIIVFTSGVSPLR